MPTLPDYTALGSSPSGNSGRIMADPSIATNPSRDNAAAAGLAGSGLKAFGAGVAQAGRVIGGLIDESDRKQNELDVARAQSDWLIRKSKLDDERGGEQDQDVLRKEYPGKYQDALDGASSLIRDPSAREKFRLATQHHVEQGGIASNNRADTLQKDAFTAGVYTQSQGLLDAGLKAKSEDDRAAAIEAHGKLIDGMVENGYMTQAAAAKAKNDWAQNFAKRSLEMMAPTQRLQALKPVNVGEASKQAMDFFQSKGWTPEQAAGIVGNLIHESGGRLDPGARNPGDGADGSDSLGIGQWNAERADALKKFSASRGASWTDYKTQLEFVQHELENNESSAGNALRGAKDVRGATEAFLGYERPKGYEGGLGAAHGGANRLHQAQGVLANLTGKGTLGQSKLADILPPDTRKSMADATESEIVTDLRQSADVRRQLAATTKTAIGDDASSIMATGKPIDSLTPEKVGAALGPAAQSDFVDTRARAQKYFQQTGDFDSLPSDQIAQRVAALKPEAGSVGYDKQQHFYDQAQKRAQAIITARTDDPAGSVNNLPIVQASLQQFNPAQPDSFSNVIKARLAAQDAIGIPAQMRSAISEAEAKSYATQLRPFAKGQADIVDQAGRADALAKEVQSKYGAYAKDAWTRILEHVTLKRDLSEVLADAITKSAAGEPPPLVTPDAAKKVQMERDAQRAATVAGASTQPSYQSEYSDMGAAYGSAAGQKPPTAQGKELGWPSAKALDLLRTDPARMMPHFLQRFIPEAVPDDLKQYLPQKPAGRGAAQ